MSENTLFLFFDLTKGNGADTEISLYNPPISVVIIDSKTRIIIATFFILTNVLDTSDIIDQFLFLFADIGCSKLSYDRMYFFVSRYGFL